MIFCVGLYAYYFVCVLRNEKKLDFLVDIQTFAQQN